MGTTNQGNSRRVFSELVGIVTNHNYLASYEHKIGRIDSPNCTICESDIEMNSHHIIFECEALEDIRRNSFKKLIEPDTLEEGPENPQRYKYNNTDHNTHIQTIHELTNTTTHTKQLT